MNRSRLWRKGVAFTLILLMVFMAAGISAPAVQAEWAEGDPYYTYYFPPPYDEFHYFAPRLLPGEPASVNVTIGINWGTATARDVPTLMSAFYICPTFGYDHIAITFDPSTFTLEVYQTQTVLVTVSIIEPARTDNYFSRIMANDVGGETPVIAEGYPEGPEINPYIFVAEGCFIATAAYGTSTAAELDTLRAFRDEVLLENSLGSQLVALYYDVSPPVADFISEHEGLRTLVRELLVDPVASLVEATAAIWRD